MRINQRYRLRLYWGREEANHLLSFISSPLLNPLFPTSVRAVCTFVSLAPHASSLACHCVTFSIVSMVNCYSSPKIQLKKFSPCLSLTHMHTPSSVVFLSFLHSINTSTRSRKIGLQTCYMSIPSYTHTHQTVSPLRA